MKMLSPVVLGLSLAVAGSVMAAAQDDSQKPPVVLQITREFLKPYKGGTSHDKTESAFVTAMTKANFPANYIGLNSMSGKERGLYLTIYEDGFAEWEKDNKLVEKNPALAAELDRASVADADNLSQVDSGVFTFDADLSYKSRKDLAHARYVEISEFHVKAGHTADWHKLGKMVKDAHEKGGTSAHWSMYEVAYGAPDGTYLAISADDSMADIDKGYMEDKKFRDAMGEDGMKELHRLFAETVDSSESELFSINPKQSYPRAEWVKTDPDFWKPKPAAAKPAAAPAAAKPAAAAKP
jgi:hypothetical protein